MNITKIIHTHPATLVTRVGIFTEAEQIHFKQILTHTNNTLRNKINTLMILADFGRKYYFAFGLWKIPNSLI